MQIVCSIHKWRHKAEAAFTGVFVGGENPAPSAKEEELEGPDQGEKNLGEICAIFEVSCWGGGGYKGSPAWPTSLRSQLVAERC